MESRPVTVSALFGNKLRYCIPVFQRHYVWTLEEQWEPFWEDIKAKAIGRLDPEIDVYPHYVGAIVLEAGDTDSVKRVTYFNTIDGQQRLSTMQLFLAALRDVSLEDPDLKAISTAIERYLFNPDEELMLKPEEERYKVWPTRYDREIFLDIIQLKSIEKVAEKHPEYFYRGRLRKKGYIPNLLGAYIYFIEQIKGFLNPDDDQFWYQMPKEELLQCIYNSFCNDFKVVEIQLDKNDDAQVIFETLNARGTPLEASDLIRNYIFWRCEREETEEDEYSIYKNYWGEFEEYFWTQMVKQGRYRRSRLEFFMLNYLTAHDINHKRIFQEYKRYIQKKSTYLSVIEELNDLKKYAKYYSDLTSTEDNNQWFDKFANTLYVWDVTTVHPLALEVMTQDIEDNEKNQICNTIESYLIRRSVCQKTAKNYNNIFLQVLRYLRDNGFTNENLNKYLKEQTGDSSNWPNDNEFKHAWLNNKLYDSLGSSRLQDILTKIEKAQRNKFSEEIDIKSRLTVEHIMPVQWEEHWPLSNGQKVTVQDTNETQKFLYSNEEPDEISKEILEREASYHTIGNLTLLTQQLNSSISNGSYENKREAILKQSSLTLNRYLHDHMEWNVEKIRERGELLWNMANEIWKY